MRTALSPSLLFCLMVAIDLPTITPTPAPKLPPVEPATTQAYLYVEPHEARFEFLIPLPLAIEWLNESQFKGTLLPAEVGTELKTKAAALASTWLQAGVNRHPAETDLVVTEIVGGRPGATLPLPPDRPIETATSLLGFVWAIPVGPSPEQISLRWQGFIEQAPSFPLRTFFGKDSETVQLSEVAPSTTWINNDRLPAPPPLAPVPRLNQPATLALPLGAILWIVGGLAVFIAFKIRRYHIPGGSTSHVFVWLIGALMMSRLFILHIPDPRGEHADPITTAAHGDPIVSPLLRNIYRAFDQRDEESIYDVLALSADGPLLKELYLDTLQGLTLEQSEGARVRVEEFAADVIAIQPTDRGFIAETSWSAMGTVGHWGHNHTRTNVNEAKITVEPRDGVWKITAIEILDQRRL